MVRELALQRKESNRPKHEAVMPDTPGRHQAPGGFAETLAGLRGVICSSLFRQILVVSDNTPTPDFMKAFLQLLISVLFVTAPLTSPSRAQKLFPCARQDGLRIAVTFRSTGRSATAAIDSVVRPDEVSRFGQSPGFLGVPADSNPIPTGIQ